MLHLVRFSNKSFVALRNKRYFGSEIKSDWKIVSQVQRRTQTWQPETSWEMYKAATDWRDRHIVGTNCSEWFCDVGTRIQTGGRNFLRSDEILLNSWRITWMDSTSTWKVLRPSASTKATENNIASVVKLLELEIRHSE